MTNSHTLLLCLVLLSALASASVSGDMLAQAGQSTDVVHELFTSWQAISIMGVMVSAMFVAVAYMLGIGLEMPGLKAWAGIEVGQVVASALIILLMIVLLAVIDTQVSLLVNSQIEGMTSCQLAGEPCLKNAATFYLEGYIKLAKSATRNLLINNMEVTEKAYERSTWSCYSAVLPLPCLQLSTGSSKDAYLILYVDTNQVLYEHYTNLLSSMEAQKLFVSSVCFKIAPFILAVGVVGRTFFVTRKLGGLLIAAAAALMFVLPLMYIFDWMTLNLEFSQDKQFGDQASLCPAECQAQPALVFDSKTSKTYEQKALYNMFYDAGKDPLIAKKLIRGEMLSYDWATAPQSKIAVTPPDPALTSCQATAVVPIDSLGGGYAGKCAGLVNGSMIVGECGSSIFMVSQDVMTPSATPGGSPTVEKKTIYVGNTSIECPYICRELPYLYTNPLCAPPIVQRACSLLPMVCKVSRMANAETVDNYRYENMSCVEECKIVPPLRSDCSTNMGNCSESRLDCRIAKRDDLGFRTSLIGTSEGGDSDLAMEYQRCEWAKDCKASLDASDSCTYVRPADPASCTDLCPSCPSECRVAGEDQSDPKKKLPDKCYNGGALISECSSSLCPDSCKIPISRLERLDPDYTACKAEGGGQCPYACRVGGVFPIPDGCDKAACDLSVCSGAYKETVPSSSCQKCLDVDENFQFDPPVLTKCADYCASPKNPTQPSLEPLTMNGFVGGGDYQNLAQLMIQAYLLPLFNFAVTLMFIRAFSGMIGGDIELPGVAKVL